MSPLRELQVKEWSLNPRRYVYLSTTRQSSNHVKVELDFVLQILIRFPNGERREHSFLCTDKIQSIFSYIDSLGLPGIGNYRLISNFPRRAYGVDQMRMTLKEAAMYPKASVFVEPLGARVP